MLSSSDSMSVNVLSRLLESVVAMMTKIL